MWSGLDWEAYRDYANKHDLKMRIHGNFPMWEVSVIDGDGMHICNGRGQCLRSAIYSSAVAFRANTGQDFIKEAKV